jgi:hypothetical protein
MALRLALLLLLAGCASTATTNGARQLESNAAMMPFCIFWCISTKSIVFQEGAVIRDNSGSAPLTIEKPVALSVTESINATTTRPPAELTVAP